MTILVSPNSPERLEVGKRAYLLKPPAVHERVKWRRAVAAAGGRNHGQLALLGVMAEGVNEMMAEDPPEVREAVLKKISDHRDNITKLGLAAIAGAYDDIGKLSDEDRDAMQADVKAMTDSGRALAVIEQAVADGYPRYNQMLADDAVYFQVAGVEAARLFVVGWEGIAGKPARNAAGLTEQALAKIPENDFAVIGAKLEALAKVSEAERKNSASPPLSSSGGETSNT